MLAIIIYCVIGSIYAIYDIIRQVNILDDDIFADLVIIN